MALSGLGPSLSGAYLNVQRALLERKLQQEDLDRRRQEALADRQAQWAEEMRRIMLQRQWEEKRQEAEKRDPETQIRLLQSLAAMGVPGLTVDPAILGRIESERLGGAQVFPRATSMPLETPPGVYQAPIKPFPVGGPKPRRTYGEAYPAGNLKPGWAGMAMPIDAQGNEKPDANAFVEGPKPADILAREKHVLETTETPQKVYKRGYDRVKDLAAAARGASTPEEARGAAVAHNTQLAATNRELKRQGLTELPFKPINIQAAMQGVARKTAGGATETFSGLKLTAWNAYLAGKATPAQKRLLFGAGGEESTKETQLRMLDAELAAAVARENQAKVDATEAKKMPDTKEWAATAKAYREARTNAAAIRAKIASLRGAKPTTTTSLDDFYK